MSAARGAPGAVSSRISANRVQNFSICLLGHWWDEMMNYPRRRSAREQGFRNV
jgi:hypothetical protein